MISILAPLTGRDGSKDEEVFGYQISILAPLTGRDSGFDGAKVVRMISILAPLTGRDATASGVTSAGAISILAPLTGRDGREDYAEWLNNNFNPRAPYGARPEDQPADAADNRFQSSRPLRGATHNKRVLEVLVPISILAPLTGRDADFVSKWFHKGISILAPLTGRDLCSRSNPLISRLFQSSRPLRGAT